MNIRQKTKQLTGRLLAYFVSLHIAAIRRNAEQYSIAAELADQAYEQSKSDLANARKACTTALDASCDADEAEVAAWNAARSEIAALPSVNGYGAVRTDPPFGAQPVVIDKRAE